MVVKEYKKTYYSLPNIESDSKHVIRVGDFAADLSRYRYNIFATSKAPINTIVLDFTGADSSFPSNLIQIWAMITFLARIKPNDLRY